MSIQLTMIILTWRLVIWRLFRLATPRFFWNGNPILHVLRELSNSTVFNAAESFFQFKVMIRNQRRVAIRQLDKELNAIKKTVEMWQKLRNRATKQEEIANADQAIKHLVSQAMSLFLKRKPLYLNKTA